MNKLIVSLLLVLVFCNTSDAKVINDDLAMLKSKRLSLSASITQYDTQHSNAVISRTKIPINDETQSVKLQQSAWNFKTNLKAIGNRAGVYDLSLTFYCISGHSAASSVSLNLDFDNWSTQNYVLMPAAAYNGNRENSQRHHYCPFWFDTNDLGLNKPQLISDVPRLNIKDGPSRIQFRSGDMSTPAIGFQDPNTKQGFWLLTNQETRLGDSGIDIEETDDRNQASISITAPVVREKYRYFIADMQYPSTDKPVDFSAGDSITIQTRIFFFSSPEVQNLFDYFASIRNELIQKGKHIPSIPMSAAFSIQEEKYNRENFEPKFGYYSVGLRESYSQDWQIGWTGGMISTYPLLANGSNESRQNVIRNFDWLFPNGISPSGYFWDSGEKGNLWGGIFPSSPLMKDWHLVRKSGDGLYYVLKQLYTFKQEGIEVKPAWKEGVKRVADTFVKTWEKYGQLGNYVDNTTGEIVVGGSTAAGIVPGALALAASYFNEPGYLEIAKQIASQFDEKYISKGLIYGAAGDALQNFDSESTYALLESYTVLYDQTHEVKWLKIAENLSNQFLTWVHSYDYRFPVSSTLGKLGKTTTGAVWANTQNKHAAPGICTHSGLALLRLYRATGNVEYLNRLQDITRAIPQYLSTKENPIPGMRNGWISERVSTTDWLEGNGEIFSGSTWAETSLMLTYTEIPGIYVVPGKKVCIAFDQVEAMVVKSTGKKLEIEIKNPTKYPASVKLFIDKNIDEPLSQTFLMNPKTVELKAGEIKRVDIDKMLKGG
ncbi:MAG: hypothetical protein GZ094_11820 [Mariniphaga sp.]|nr:hypothetical protein [Mariniphaga sp.]